ncbi:MAG: hypothetical protein R3F47_16825 [Gammaproteobacteria bacterium]
MSVNVVLADSFDDAVNLYLKGFDHCLAAKEALGSNDTARARAEFGRYEALLQQAAGIDGAILQSTQRGMDSNLKHCQRVGTDLQITEGRPLLERAIAACDTADAQLKQGDVDTARSSHQQFVALRDQALAQAPALNEVFSLRSEIRRCERLERKIASSGQQQAVLTSALQSALDASETYQSSCQAALEEMNRTGADSASVQNARKLQTAVQARRKEAATELAALKSASRNAPLTEQAAIEKRIADGDACLARLHTALADREQQLQVAQTTVQDYLTRINRSNDSCTALRQRDSGTRAEYEEARNRFEAARKTRDDIKAGMARLNLPADNTARQLDGAVATLDRCLDQVRPQLGRWLASLSAPAVPVQAAPISASVNVAAKKSAPANSSAPAIALDGSLTIDDLLPPFAVVYWQEDGKLPDTIDVTISATRFDSKLYFMRPGANIRVKSEDFAIHTIEASMDGKQSVTERIRSRQRGTLKTAWPADSIAVLRSDQARIEPSYIVNTTASRHAVLEFGGDAKTVKIELPNPGKSGRGVLLMPDYDALSFEIAQGEEKTLPVTRGGVALGSVQLKGL